MNNCRGQGYDNGVNMMGKLRGVRTRINNLYPRAFFQSMRVPIIEFNRWRCSRIIGHVYPLQRVSQTLVAIKKTLQKLNFKKIL
jgi:hypothetical protein